MDAARSTALALLLLFVAVAGCSAIPDTAPDADGPAATTTPLPIESPTPTPTSTPTRHTDPVRYAIGDSNLGEYEEPHSLCLVNTRNDTTVAATLRLTHEDAEVIFETTYTLSPDEEQHGVLTSKANYTVTATVGNQNATEHLPKAMFDCNDSTTTFTITDDNITTRTLSTAVGCPTGSPE